MTDMRISPRAAKIYLRLGRYADLIENHRRFLEPGIRSKSERLSQLYIDADREIVRLKELGASNW